MSSGPLLFCKSFLILCAQRELHHVGKAVLPLLGTCVETAKEMDVAYHVGNILSSDRFYGDDGDMPEGWNANHGWKKMGVLAVEMEAAALYMNAARAGKRALAICTVSDHILHHEATTAEERQNGFTQMMELALKTSVKLEK